MTRPITAILKVNSLVTTIGGRGGRKPVTPFRILCRLLFACVLLLLLNVICAGLLIWSAVDRAGAALKGSEPWTETGEWALDLQSQQSDQAAPEPFGQFTLQQMDGGARLYFSVSEHAGLITVGSKCELWYPKQNACFRGGATSLPLTRNALADAFQAIPRIHSWFGRIASVLSLRPVITGWESRTDGRRWKIRIRDGQLLAGMRSNWIDADLNFRHGDEQWTIELRSQETASDLPIDVPPQDVAQDVASEEIDRSLASAVNIAALRAQPVRIESDHTLQEGEGTLVVKNGRRRLYLKGDAFNVGFQHGRLLSAHVERLVEHVVFGVGLLYSFEKGSWFLDDARELIQRQRQYINSAYFEEMRGLSEGSGLPLEHIQIANIFPEFFHCSGAAVYGQATKGGKLLHARVLDYMTEVGLQDEAVVIATSRDGVREFVNVGYAGFIGSVTGMNDAQLAIGEMGGRGEGDWDGTPMSFLVRGALEHCGTLEEALSYFRDHRRTCEYYYVISDGKTRSAAGIKATPDLLEVVLPGTSHPQLPEPIVDTVLMSAGQRYKDLVKRIRVQYGKIDAAALIEIIGRPVAMKSNLHNVVFSPEDRSLWIANAGRATPACSEEYAYYEWDDLFGEPR